MSSAKFVVLQKIRAERDIIFSATNPSLGITKEIKARKWMEIADLAAKLGLMNGKPWKYMRDTIWCNWRKRTMARIARGIKSLSEQDELMLEIMEKPQTPDTDALIDIDAFTESVNNDAPEEIINSKKRPSSTPFNVDLKKRQRIDLQIETLKIKAYKMRLEALELEMRLGLPRSAFTRNIPEAASSNSDELYKTEQ